MENIVIIGTSTAAEVVCQFIEEYQLFNIIGFAVNKEYRSSETYMGKPVYEIETLDTIIDKNNDYIFVAIQWNNLNADRRKVFENLRSQGYKFANLISPNSLIHGTIKGSNCWVTDGCIIDYGAVINDNTFIKIGAFIADGTVISSHCFIGARSVIGGGVKIGEQTFVGLGAIIFENTVVGKKCVVGAATALKRNLPDFSVYKTQTDVCIAKIYDEDIIETKLQFRRNIR